VGFSDLVKLKLKELEEPHFDEKLSGARAYDTDRVSPGYNLFDGRLIDIDGRVVKTWKERYLGVILPDGRYVAQEHYESKKWGMYTWDDKPVWEKDVSIHHDIVITPANTILTSTKEMHHSRIRS